MGNNGEVGESEHKEMMKVAAHPVGLSKLDKLSTRGYRQ